MLADLPRPSNDDLGIKNRAILSFLSNQKAIILYIHSAKPGVNNATKAGIKIIKAIHHVFSFFPA